MNMTKQQEIDLGVNKLDYSKIDWAGIDYNETDYEDIIEYFETLTEENKKLEVHKMVKGLVYQDYKMRNNYYSQFSDSFDNDLYDMNYQTGNDYSINDVLASNELFENTIGGVGQKEAIELANEYLLRPEDRIEINQQKDKKMGIFNNIKAFMQSTKVERENIKEHLQDLKYKKEDEIHREIREQTPSDEVSVGVFVNPEEVTQNNQQEIDYFERDVAKINTTGNFGDDIFSQEQRQKYLDYRDDYDKDSIKQGEYPDQVYQNITDLVKVYNPTIIDKEIGIKERAEVLFHYDKELKETQADITGANNNINRIKDEQTKLLNKFETILDVTKESLKQYKNISEEIYTKDGKPDFDKFEKVVARVLKEPKNYFKNTDKVKTVLKSLEAQHFLDNISNKNKDIKNGLTYAKEATEVMTFYIEKNQVVAEKMGLKDEYQEYSTTKDKSTSSLVEDYLKAVEDIQAFKQSNPKEYNKVLETKNITDNISKIDKVVKGFVKTPPASKQASNKISR